MFLHIGLNTVLDVKDIVAIVNIDNPKCAVRNPEERAVNISGQSGQRPKSLIFFDDGIHTVKYLSPISSLTLKKRMN